MIMAAQQEFDWEEEKMTELADVEARARAKANEWLQGQKKG